MSRVLSTVVLTLVFHLSYTQSISIINSTTLEPVSDVFVYHENQINTTFSMENGKVDLDGFPDLGILIFQHPAYNDQRISIQQLNDQKRTVKLVERVIQFEELTVTSNRWEEDKDEVSQEIITIGAKTISFQNPATSADLLSQSGEVFVQKSQLGGGSPMLRGFSANSVLLVVDGVRLNNAIYRSGNLQNVINIDANAISNAEIIYGPGSVMYGSDAMGGVMDFHTKKLHFTSSSKPKVSGSAFARYSTASNEKTGHLNLDLSGEKVSFFGSISKSQLGDLRSGSNRSSGYENYFYRDYYAARSNGEDILVGNEDPNLQVGSGYDLFNIIGKIGIKTGEQSELTYGAYYSTTSDIPRYDRLNLKEDNSDSLVYAEWHYGPQKWMMHNLALTMFKNTPFYNQARITAAYQNYEESRNDRRFGDTSKRTTQESVNLYTLSIDFDKEFTKSSLFYGFDFFYNDVRSQAYLEDIITLDRTSTSTRYPNGGSQYYTSAAYTNYVYRHNDHWTFNAGARYSDVTLHAETDDPSALNLLLDNISLKNQALNGMLGIIYNPSEKSRWNLLFSSGFRAPNVDDVGKLFEIDDQIVVVPNPDLKPEYTYNQELSYQYREKNMVLNMVVFHSLLTDAIVRGSYEINGSDEIEMDGETKLIRAQVNEDRARIYGGSAKVSSQLSEKLGISGSISLTEGYLTENNEPLRHIPPTFGRFGLIYLSGKLKSEIYTDFNFNKPATDIPDSEIVDKYYLYTSDGTPSWATFNFKSQYIINQSATVQIGLENVFDTHYRPYSSGISAPGRNFIITLRGNF